MVICMYMYRVHESVLLNKCSGALTVECGGVLCSQETVTYICNSTTKIVQWEIVSKKEFVFSTVMDAIGTTRYWQGFTAVLLSDDSLNNPGAVATLTFTANSTTINPSDQVLCFDPLNYDIIYCDATLAGEKNQVLTIHMLHSLFSVPQTLRLLL